MRSKIRFVFEGDIQVEKRFLDKDSEKHMIQGRRAEAFESLSGERLIIFTEKLLYMVVEEETA